MSDRRHHGRISTQLTVKHIVDERTTCECAVEDVSLDGMRVRRIEGGDWGTPQHVWLRFELPDGGEAIQALGELRHEGEEEAVRGFRIKYIFPRARRRYEAYVREQLAA